ncbi:MAG: SDR family oxidoreductase [Chthoniobacterales bacterium]
MKTVLITGANRGIGHALAIAFASADWRVLAGARHLDTPAMSAAAKRFSNFEPVEIDVLDDSTVARAALALEDDALDVLVNNAAIFPGDGDETLESLDLNWFAESVETNVAGVARVSRAFLPALRRSDHPRIVNVSSGAGSIADKADYSYYPYSVSKAALNMLTRAMAAEFASENIIVTAISPGWVKTEMGGPNAEISAEESASSLFETITTLAKDRSGCFLGRHGRPEGYRW